MAASGDMLKAKMAERRWSVADMAMILGVHESSVSRLRTRGVGTPRMAKALSAAFDDVEPIEWLRADFPAKIAEAKRRIEARRKTPRFARSLADQISKHEGILAILRAQQEPRP